MIRRRRYANHALPPEELKQCLYSIGDNNAYLYQVHAWSCAYTPPLPTPPTHHSARTHYQSTSLHSPLHSPLAYPLAGPAPGAKPGSGLTRKPLA